MTLLPLHARRDGQVPTYLLDAGLRSPELARAHVRNALGPGDASDVAQLLVTELVTNAVLHGEAPVALEIRRRGRRLRIAVVDSSPAGPRPQDPEMTDTSGRGLLLVDALAASWGWEPSGRGKIVWFEL
jgi:anti-sigma regulatory factor (Ser/Thr protein kinase)